MAAQKQSGGDTTLFPVHLAYSVYDNIAICTVTVRQTQAEDLISLSIYNESPALREARRAEFEALLKQVGTEQGQAIAMHRLAPLEALLGISTRWATYNAATGLHEKMVGMGDFFRLHLEVIRSRQSLAEANIVYLQGVMRAIEPVCRGLTLSIEQRPFNPMTKVLLDHMTSLPDADY